MRKIWSINNEIRETETALEAALFTRSVTYNEVLRLNAKLSALRTELSRAKHVPAKSKTQWFNFLPALKPNFK